VWKENQHEYFRIEKKEEIFAFLCMLIAEEQLGLTNGKHVLSGLG